MGKTLKEEKQTRDIVDIVLKNEKFAASVTEIKNEKPKEQVLKIAKKSVQLQNETMKKEDKSKDLTQSLKITFKKPLTQREQAVLEHFIKNKNQIVFAKDLASVLELPTDYVYKYIKNLRTKINEDILQNATKGGYRLNA